MLILPGAAASGIGLKRSWPMSLSKASAKMLRAELWVQRNRTFSGDVVVMG